MTPDRETLIAKLLRDAGELERREGIRTTFPDVINAVREAAAAEDGRPATARGATAGLAVRPYVAGTSLGVAGVF